MTWLEWIDHVGQFTIAKIIGWVVGVTAVLIGIRQVWPWIKRFVRMVDTIADLPDRLDNIEKWQEVTATELTDNHGSTLKDAVKRTEATAAELRSKLEIHIEFCRQRERLLGTDAEEQ